jgi:hypothetical protein
MAGLVTNQLQLTILATEDSTNNVLVNRTVSPLFDGLFADFVSYAKTPDLATHNLIFPSGFNTMFQVYIRNLDAAGSLLISAIPVGGGLVSFALLGPGDVFVVWAATEGAPAVGGTTQGYTQINITGSAVGVKYEYYLGA